MQRCERLHGKFFFLSERAVVHVSLPSHGPGWGPSRRPAVGCAPRVTTLPGSSAIGCASPRRPGESPPDSGYTRKIVGRPTIFARPSALGRQSWTHRPTRAGSVGGAVSTSLSSGTRTLPLCPASG